ncbi:hypothetical protein EON66_04680 [archaeon]|nr:MAG: hypothetical protein EON66_04680 [archaeon]
MGLTSDIILSALNRLSKVPITDSVIEYVTACTAGYGKAKLVLLKYVPACHVVVRRGVCACVCAKAGGNSG